MTAALQLAGQTFSRLRVIRRSPKNSSTGRSRWHCICQCGNTTTVCGSDLRNGNTVSCGCWRKEVVAARSFVHGMASPYSREYHSWAGMRSRCLNPNHLRRKDYGARGISICKRWDKFKNFLADMGRRPPGTSLDRINNNGDYKPSNCRWATPKQQAANRRNPQK